MGNITITPAHILQQFRHQGWERAKAELKNCLNTFYGDSEQYDKFSKAVKEFIKEVEDEGWQE